MTPEERAIEGEREIKELSDLFLNATRRLNHSRDEERDPYDPARAHIYRSLLVETCDRARDYFNSIEATISGTELLGLQRSELWAKNLSRTAANGLSLACEHYPRIRADYRDFFKEDAPEPSRDAFYAMECAVALQHAERAKELKTRLQEARLPIGGFTDTAKMNTRYSNTDKYVMFATAIAFVLIMLAIGVFVKDFNDVNIFIFRVVLALTAGAFGGVFIPGLFQIKAKGANFAVKACGAAAFFVAVYFTNPPALVKNAVPAKAVEEKAH